MIPLTLADKGKNNIIKKIMGNSETKRFLESLGFVCESYVSVISESGGNVIVSIKDSRIAISREIASKIMI